MPPSAWPFTDMHGHLLRVNKAMCEMLGYTQQELLGSDFEDLTYPEDVFADRARLEQMRAGAISTYQREKRCVRRNGDIVWVLVSASAGKGSGENPLSVIVHVQDLSKHMRLEADLRDLALNDRLTGLANRRSVCAEVTALPSRNSVTAAPSHLLMAAAARAAIRCNASPRRSSDKRMVDKSPISRDKPSVVCATVGSPSDGPEAV